MKITYDDEAHAAYINLTDQRRRKATTKQIAPNIMLDTNDKNQVVGIELLNITRPYVAEYIYPKE